MADLELGAAVAEYQESFDDEQRIASLKKVSSQVKHKALAESTAVSIIALATEAMTWGGDVKDASLSLLAYLVRRIHSQGQLESSKVAAALNTVPNWPDTLNALRKRGVPADIRNELQMALERPPPSSASQSRPAPADKKQAAGSRPPPSGKSTLGRLAGPPQGHASVEPIYVASASDLDQMCSEMLPDFEGKESEHNWPRRDKHILKLRQITQGNAPGDFTNAYIANWKILLDGIIKCATSLRTTFSTNGCQFIQEAAAVAGHGLDPYAGRLLEISVKMCGDTKPIAAQNGDSCVTALIANVSWSRQIVSYIMDACQDKNVRPREYSYGWIKTALQVHGQRKSVLEQSHGAENFEKCFKRGMADQNPKVRETAKKAFWDFHQVWPTRGDALLTSFDERTQKSIKALNSAGGAAASAAAAPAAAPASSLASAKIKSLANRPSIKDMMATKRREAQKMAERPQSALASFSSAEPRVAKKPAVPAQRSAAEHSAVGGGLSSAPVRPGRKVLSRAVSRPEMSVSAEAADRPKTPFRSGAPRRPESRADEKREGPRRPVAAAAAPPPKAPVTTSRPAPKRIPQPSSLPASPEKMYISPASRRPKSITEDSPILRRSIELPERPRLGTPSSPERKLRVFDSPLQNHLNSRLSTPARVYEDPRTSPSPSPQSKKTEALCLSTRDDTKNLENKALPSGSAGNVRSGGDASLVGGEFMSPVKMPLAELSMNEVSSPPLTGEYDPRYAKLIDSGIVHMKNGRLDPYGYRRLHAVVQDQVHALSAEKFQELLTTVLNAAPAGQENTSVGNATATGERILLQRLHLLTALGKSPLIQQSIAQVLRALIHIIRHEAIHNGHTYWIAEGQLREFAETCAEEPNKAARGVLAEPQDKLQAIVIKCISFLVQNTKFDKEDTELVSAAAAIAGQAIALEKDVDARIQGHNLAKSLGIDTIKKVLGEEQGGVAFMLYQSMKSTE